MSYQYNELLAGQLEAQRHHYEALLQSYRTQRDEDGRQPSGKELLEALGREKRQLEQRCSATRRRLEQVHDEIGVVTAWNGSLEENCGSWDKQVAMAEGQMASVVEARNRWVPEVKSNVHVWVAFECAAGLAGRG